MKAYILAGGKGTKIWPYNTCHNKTMIPLCNQPILKHLIDALQQSDITEIIVIAYQHVQEIKHYFKDNQNVKVIELSDCHGAASSLKVVEDHFIGKNLVIYGDCMIEKDDLVNFINSDSQVLLSQLHQDAKEMICAEVENRFVKRFWGHPRGDHWQYFAAAFKLDETVFPFLETTQAYFNTTKVGVGSPHELYLENTINDMIDQGYLFSYMISKQQIFDIDKPWHILEANQYYNQLQTQGLVNNVDQSSQISPSAKILGQVVLGKNSYIGDYVIIEGNVVIGDDCIIDNGAIIGDGCIIGNRCQIKNHCKIAANCSIGDDCIVDQTAELLGGVLFSKVYLYHYGEYYGVIGQNTDLGAGTTCGTLRFDDGETEHYIKGKRQVPQNFSNACFIGDYSRTGVGAILLPGCKIGSKSVVGSGVILNEDVEDETLIYAKQELVKVKWGDSKYGW